MAPEVLAAAKYQRLSAAAAHAGCLAQLLLLRLLSSRFRQQMVIEEQQDSANPICTWIPSMLRTHERSRAATDLLAFVNRDGHLRWLLQHQSGTHIDLPNELSALF
jgi:hypothetical protein